jgi:uncharacterized integral membrane protein (TIGR00698 family)
MEGFRQRLGSVVPGLGLCAGVGAAALALEWVFPLRPALPEVLLALLLGTLIVNTPLGRAFGMARAGSTSGAADRIGPGVTFVTKTLLRVAVVLMGLRVEAHLFAAHDLLTVLVIVAATMPATFFLTHALALPLRVPRAQADLVAAGTMICGASAVNAVAPVVGARQQDQGIALGTIFLFSAVAMCAFRAVACAAGLPAHTGGLWSGLAVNDLASAVAVGAQMGPGGAEMAAASKSLRVLLLAPVLVMFAVARGSQETRATARQNAVRHLPRFVGGFVLLALVRFLGDRTVGGEAWWRTLLACDQQAVAFAMTMVSAAIGFNLRIRGLLAAGARAVTLGAVSASATAGLSLVLLHLSLTGALTPVVTGAAAALVGSYAVYRIVRKVKGIAVVRRPRHATDGGVVAVAHATGVSGGSVASYFGTIK